MITVKILADSINPSGTRLTSWLLTYPRFIHSEFLTHRVFSRNAASSRAIPYKKMADIINDNPAMPERWPKEQKGMQGGEELDGQTKFNIQSDWRTSSLNALNFADSFHKQGLHKSLCNRLLEPWAHITVIATATDHSNFFALRAHPAAMPEFQVLAYRMLDQYLKSGVEVKQWGDWHIPKFSDEVLGLSWEGYLKVATAHCARLSYLTHEGEYSIDADIALHDRLMESGHWSPFEHCAQAINVNGNMGKFKTYPWSNFDPMSQGLVTSGWGQYRKLFDGENITGVNFEGIMASKPDWITI